MLSEGESETSSVKSKKTVKSNTRNNNLAFAGNC